MVTKKQASLMGHFLIILAKERNLAIEKEFQCLHDTPPSSSFILVPKHSIGRPQRIEIAINLQLVEQCQIKREDDNINGILK